jgi:hypothetical protein
MPTRTVAPGGGNFSAGATWVGGVAPVNNDSIIANSSSGNLTLTVGTVNLQSADFTGYTGTLNLQTNNMIFNATPAGGTISLSPTMTISRTAGTNATFRVNANTTIISNGKVIPFSSTSNPTITLSGDLTANIVNSLSSPTFTGGSNFIITDPAPASAGQTFTTGETKLIYRPTGGTLTLASGNRPIGSGYYQFDASTIVSSSTVGFYLLASALRTIATTIEFLQFPIFTGTGTSNNRAWFYYDVFSVGYNGLITTLIMPTNSRISKLVADSGFNNAIGLVIQNRIIIDEAFIKSSNGNTTYNITGAGFSASNVYIQAGKSSTNLENNGCVARFSSEGDYVIGSIAVAGHIGNSPSVAITSLTSSVPVNINISNGGFSYATITDINNTGTSLYALSLNGNILTRTTGFIESVPGGGGGERSSFYAS